MLNQNYYEKTGQLKFAYKSIYMWNKSNYPEEHLQAVKWAASFVEHPYIEPWNEYAKRFNELAA
jgi:hypothetical protein